MNNEELRLRTWEHKVVGGGRNSRGTTTIAPGLINTNASDIYCDLAQNTMLLRSKRAQLVDARWGRKEQRNRLEHYSEKMEHSQWGPCRHIHNPTETWQCVCVCVCVWIYGTRSDWNTEEENDPTILVQWEPAHDGVLNTVQFDLITAWLCLKWDMIRYLIASIRTCINRVTAI